MLLCLFLVVGFWLVVVGLFLRLVVCDVCFGLLLFSDYGCVVVVGDECLSVGSWGVVWWCVFFWWVCLFFFLGWCYVYVMCCGLCVFCVFCVCWIFFSVWRCVRVFFLDCFFFVGFFCFLVVFM